MNSRVFYTLIRLAVVCAALGLAAGCDDVSTAELKTPVYKTGLKDSDDNKTSAFRKDFPLQAASYDRNNESTFMSKYKGSVNFMKNLNSGEIILFVLSVVTANETSVGGTSMSSKLPLMESFPPMAAIS